MLVALKIYCIFGHVVIVEFAFILLLLLPFNGISIKPQLSIDAVAFSEWVDDAAFFYM